MRLFQRIAASIIVLLATGNRAIAQSGTNTFPQDASKLLQQGEELASANRLAEAELLLEKGAALDGQNEQLLTFLAQVKSRLGESAEAVTLFRKVADANPRSGRAHLNLAIALADAGRAQDSLQQLDSAARLDPQDARVHLNRARVLGDLQRTSEARAEFVRADQLSPDDPEVDYFWALFERDHHRPTSAVALLTKVIARQPQNARALYFLGQMQQLNGKEQDAIASWRRAVACDPSMQEAVYALSQILRDKSPEESKQLLQEFEQQHSASQNVEHVRELGNKAYAEMERQSWDTAIGILQEAIAQCGGCKLNADLHQRLGLAECHRGDLEDGERELRLALSLNPNDRETVHALDWVANRRATAK